MVINRLTAVHFKILLGYCRASEAQRHVVKTVDPYKGLLAWIHEHGLDKGWKKRKRVSGSRTPTPKTPSRKRSRKSPPVVPNSSNASQKRKKKRSSRKTSVPGNAGSTPVSKRQKPNSDKQGE